MISQKVDEAIAKRASYIKEPYDSAFRLMNGFLEGFPNIVLEVYSKTLLCHYYPKDNKEETDVILKDLLDIVIEKLPWIKTAIVKDRKSKDLKVKRGVVVFGTNVDKKTIENGIKYAVDLTMNQDSSFYLDTRNLRHWLSKNLKDKTVLNTFAYTGSLGVAALVGGAKDVVHLDLNKTFLTIAKRSTKLNGLEIDKSKYQSGDFWSRINQFKKSEKTFDCVILDPPVYAQTNKGTIDLAKNYDKLINKVRPLINDGGYLITINNALFQTGKDHKAQLDGLCKSGYLKIEEIIPVPEDCIGTPKSVKKNLPADPTPYNHSTKITILSVKKK